jgi:hypothetical protein
VREVDRRQVDALVLDVLPDVELGPVRQREDADALAEVDATVVEVPELRPLVLRVPLAELVAEREHPLLRARLVLVAPGAAEGRGEPILLERVEQHRRLDPVAGAVRRLLHQAALQRLRHAGDEELDAELRHAPVAELQDLGEVVAGVDVHHRERDPRRVERLLRQPQHDDRVLAAAEQQHRPLQLGDHLADDVDRLRLEGLEMRDAVLRHGS